MKRISASLLGGAVLGAALLVACGGGGGSSGSSVPGGPPPVATDPPAGAPQSFSATDAVAIPSPAPGAVTVPVALPSDPSGASASAALPATANIPPDATVAATYSTSTDSIVPLAHGRNVQGRTVSTDTTTPTRNIIAYLKLQFSADVTLPQAPSFSFVIPRTLPTAGVTYWLAFLDPLRAAAAWQQGFEGPATVTATTANGKAATQLAFASNGQPLSFVANQTYYFAVVGVSATTATPTPVPSSVPSNPPPDTKPAPMYVTPRNLQFATVTTSTPAPITFVQQGFTGTFTLHGDCTGIVNTSGASPTFTVTPIGVGRCVIVGIGDRGASAVVHVGVVTPYETPRPSTSPSPEPSHSPYPTYPPTASPSPEPSHSPKPTYPPTATPSPVPSHSPEPTHAPTTAPTNPPGSNASPSPNPH